MIKLIVEEQKKLQVIDNQENILSHVKENMWIHMVMPSIAEVEQLSDIVNINRDFLVSLLDDEESARLDVDDDYTLIVLDIPCYEDDVYYTYPFAIIYNEKYYITLCRRETGVVNSVLTKFKKVEPHKHVRLTLQIMYRIASNYIQSLKVIDNLRLTLEKALQSSTKNSDLLLLMDLNKSLVYFSTSLHANRVVLNKVKRLAEYKKYEDDFDLMEDVEVENNQAIEMCTIYRDILSGIMDAFSSIISNNLNTVMKVLAIITLIISIPTLIASLFGMNVQVPFAKEEAGFIIILIISAICSIIGGALLLFYTSKSNKKRKK